MRRSSCCSLCALASVVAGLCCTSSPAPPRLVAASAPIACASVVPGKPGALTPEVLDEMAREMAARRTCKDSCCLGTVPLAYAPSWPGKEPETLHAVELRAILDGPASPAAHGLAARWLAHASDINDLLRLARCIDSTESAGTFPAITVSQGFRLCEVVDWNDKTLGRVCIDAIEGIVGQNFVHAADVRAWLSAHESPLDSYDYWQRVLSHSHPAVDSLLERLHHRNVELYFRVASLDPEILGPNAELVFTRVAHDDVGGDRVLRLLRRQDTFPELDSPERFATFATTVLRRAAAILEPRSFPELLALWENRGCCTQDFVRAELAVAVSRLMPEQSRRVLKATLAELVQTHASVHAHAKILEELARRHALQDQALLQAWFLGPDAIRTGSQDELATAILRGLKDAAPASRPVLASLLRGKAPSAGWNDAVEALMAVAIAVGYPAPAQCRGYLFARAGKTSSREARDAAERAATSRREVCTQGVLKWLRSP